MHSRLYSLYIHVQDGYRNTNNLYISEQHHRLHNLEADELQQQMTKLGSSPISQKLVFEATT